MTLKNTTSFDELQETFMNLLNKSAPLQCKYLRANHSKFMMKELSKAILLLLLKMKTSEAKAKYNKQRNTCVSLTRKAKRNYYESFNLNNVCDDKKFWTTVKPLFSNKIKWAENIVSSEKGILIKDEVEVANIFKDFFVNIVPNLGIKT